MSQSNLIVSKTIKDYYQRRFGYSDFKPGLVYNEEGIAMYYIDAEGCEHITQQGLLWLLEQGDENEPQVQPQRHHKDTKKRRPKRGKPGIGISKRKAKNDAVGGSA